MKRISISILFLATLFLAACGGGENKGNKAEQLAKLKQQRSELDKKIKDLEAASALKSPKKATPVSVMEVTPQVFNSFIEVQSQIVGDENILATPQAPGTVTNILVHTGQKVKKGQLLATLDAASVDQQIQGSEIALSLKKALYEKQKNLWAQGIGSEVQLMQLKADYEGALKTKEGLLATRNTFRIIAPISGTVDNMSLKLGDVATPGQSGIRVVSFDKLKAEANLGENYIGKVKTGDPVTLVFPDMNDSIKTKLSYVSQSVDPVSRAIRVQINLVNNNKFFPNMSCKMKISNYQNSNALVIPVSVVQKTAEGEMVYIADGGKAKATKVTTGRNANGMVEILSGLKAGDKIVTEGFGDLDDGEAVTF